MLLFVKDAVDSAAMGCRGAQHASGLGTQPSSTASSSASTSLLHSATPITCQRLLSRWDSPPSFHQTTSASKMSKHVDTFLTCYTSKHILRCSVVVLGRLPVILRTPYMPAVWMTTDCITKLCSLGYTACQILSNPLERDHQNLFQLLSKLLLI